MEICRKCGSAIAPGEMAHAVGEQVWCDRCARGRTWVLNEMGQWKCAAVAFGSAFVFYVAMVGPSYGPIGSPGWLGGLIGTLLSIGCLSIFLGMIFAAVARRLLGAKGGGLWFAFCLGIAAVIGVQVAGR